jgi:hypothetical protein
MAVLTLMVLLTGCQAARVTQPPLTRQYGGSDDDAKFGFWNGIADRPLISNDEAFHGLLLYKYDRDPEISYAQRVSLMKGNHYLPADFNAPADEATNRAILAYAITQMFGIKGGLMMHLLGTTPRYALLELQDMGMFPASSENQTFSGLEYVGIISKIQDYEAGELNGVPKPISTVSP